jgi:hypothetical protein
MCGEGGDGKAATILNNYSTHPASRQKEGCVYEKTGKKLVEIGQRLHVVLNILGDTDRR